MDDVDWSIISTQERAKMLISENVDELNQVEE